MTSTDTSQQETPAPPAESFPETRWSLVLRGGRSDTPQARNALEELCLAYWPPIYAFVRRAGHRPHDAEDLTQAFFARLLEKNWLAAADRSRGRFRSFLLTALKHFLANEWDRAQAEKRGGGAVFLTMDTALAESCLAGEAEGALTPEKLFDRRWALTLLEQVLQRLRDEYRGEGKQDLFAELKPTLTEASREVPYARLADRLQMSEGAVKVAVHRLRRRYRELIRALIAETVSRPEDVEDELRNLFAALGS